MHSQRNAAHLRNGHRRSALPVLLYDLRAVFVVGVIVLLDASAWGQNALPCTREMRKGMPMASSSREAAQDPKRIGAPQILESPVPEAPAENVIYQPANRDTAPGILLPLTHLSRREPFATVAIFPSDHFIMDEERFMAAVSQAVAETRRFPRELTLLGMAPDRAEEGYGWIEPGGKEAWRETLPVRQFWEKPDLLQREQLLRRGAVWNTFVCVAQATTLWEMTRQTAPDLYRDFMALGRALGSPRATCVTEYIYRTVRAVNFSSGVCELLPSRLRVLPVPEVGWSDWGSVDRILTSLKQLGKRNDCLARLRHQGTAPPAPLLATHVGETGLTTHSHDPPPLLPEGVHRHATACWKKSVEG